MRKKTTLPSVYLTDDISVMYYDNENIERYEFTRNIPDFLEYAHENGAKLYRKSQDIGEYVIKHNALCEQWQDEVGYEGKYQLPLMNALYYFPVGIEFADEDRFKVSSNCTLLYDTELSQWAIGMTAGGLDLTPHLVDTFIKLNRGVPVSLAQNMSRGYEAYITGRRHIQNCRIIGNAFLRHGASSHQIAIDLLSKRKAIY